MKCYEKTFYFYLFTNFWEEASAARMLHVSHFIVDICITSCLHSPWGLYKWMFIIDAFPKGEGGRALDDQVAKMSFKENKVLDSHIQMIFRKS